MKHSILIDAVQCALLEELLDKITVPLAAATPALELQGQVRAAKIALAMAGRVASPAADPPPPPEPPAAEVRANGAA